MWSVAPAMWLVAPAMWWVGGEKLRIKLNSAQLKLELGLSLAKNAKYYGHYVVCTAPLGPESA